LTNHRAGGIIVLCPDASVEKVEYNMNYDEAVAYLYSFTNFEVEPAKRYDPALYDRQRLVDLLARLGNPQRQFSSVHVAGSKGKGSTAALIAGMLQAAGYHTGLYTSPHLHTFRERVQINREYISEEEVAALVEELRPLVAQIPGLTTFELITVLGFLHFARSNVEIAVVEVGMGGRLDATNVLDPLVTVITALSLEHTMFLGNTLAEIAAEKAGIVKPNVPLVLASQTEPAARVIAAVCAECKAPLIRVETLWEAQVLQRSAEGSIFALQSLAAEQGAGQHTLATSLARQYTLPLLGDHQIQNACLALAATGILQERGFDVPPAARQTGMANVHWPGRMEILARRPFVIADGAHNPASARALVEAIGRYLRPRRIRFVYGSLADKDVRGVLQTLLPAAEEMIIVAPRYPRAMPVAQVMDAARTLGYAATIAPSVTEGVRMAAARANPDDLVCVTGSLFVVAEASML